MTPQDSAASFGTSPFHQRHSAVLRIWHWLTFASISGLIITVLINSTVLSSRDSSAMAQEILSTRKVEMTGQQVAAVSRQYRGRVWDLHEDFGFGLAVLLLSRVVIEWAQPEDERIRSRLRRASEAYRREGPDQADVLHYLRITRLHLVFYVALSVMVLTGLTFMFGRELGVSRGLHRIMRNIHSFVPFVIYAFILAHLGGVVLAENGRFRGVVSGMIHGNRS